MIIVKLLLTSFIVEQIPIPCSKSANMTAIILPIIRERTKRQAMQVWPHLPFLTGRGPSKMLVGEPPQTRLFGTKCPKEVGCVTAAVAPVPYE